MKSVLIVLVLFSNLVFAQDILTDGYIILKGTQDTLKGQIQDDNWEINPNKIVFQNPILTQKTFSLSELEAFGLTKNEHYIVKKVDLDVSPFGSNNLLKNPNILTVKDTLVALRILLKADLSLFYFKDSQNKTHFYYNKNQEFHELINHKYLRIKNGLVYEIQNKMYQTQLEHLFSNSPKSINTKYLNFNIEELIASFIAYNENMGCSTICYTKSKRDVNSYAFRILLGSTVVRQSSYLNHSFLNQIESSRVLQMTPLLGASINIHSKRKHGRVILGLDAWYQRHHINILEKDFKSYQNSFTISPYVKNKILTKNSLKPSFGYGLNLNFNSKPKSNQSKIKIYSEQEFTPFTVFGEAGLEFKKMSLNFRLQSIFFKINPLVQEYTKIAQTLHISTNSRLSSTIYLAYKIR
jgi:hypothetical protein